MKWFKERILPWIVYSYTVVFILSSRLRDLIYDWDRDVFLLADIACFIGVVYTAKALIKDIPDWLFKIFGNLYAYTFGINRMEKNPIFQLIVADAGEISPDAIVLYGKYQRGSRDYKVLGNYDRKKGYRFNHICFVDSIDPIKDISMQSIVEHKIKKSVDSTVSPYNGGNDYCFTKMGYRTLSKLDAFALYKALCKEFPNYTNQQGLEKISHSQTTHSYSDTETKPRPVKDYYVFYIVKKSVDVTDTDSESREKKEKARKNRERQFQNSLKRW